jgi:hypothetical protein
MKVTGCFTWNIHPIVSVPRGMTRPFAYGLRSEWIDVEGSIGCGLQVGQRFRGQLDIVSASCYIPPP